MSGEGPNEPKRPTLHASSSPVRSKGVKRKQPAVFAGNNSVPLSQDSGITCPICFNTIESAYMTECGHSFCHQCIRSALEKRNQCPKCSYTLKPDRLYPNFTLNEVILHHKQKKVKQEAHSSTISSTSDFGGLVWGMLGDELEDKINHQNISSLIDILEQKRRYLILETEIGHANLTVEFLNQIKTRKDEELRKLQQELSVISSDMSKVR